MKKCPWKEGEIGIPSRNNHRYPLCLRSAISAFVKPCLASVLVLLLVGCGGRPKQMKGEQSQREVGRLPDYVLYDVTHAFYDKGVQKIKVAFERGSYYSSEDELAVENCHFIYYDSTGRVLSKGQSRKATVFGSSARLIAEDDVVIVSEVNGGVLKTGRLEWLGETNQFVTDDFVTITRTNGDTISGQGMVTDLALRYVTINKNVKGHFKENRNL